jgi:TetR/AcrR family transcriptional repressor of nem operon
MASKGEQTRERILHAAETLVLRQGFSATAIDDILKVTRLTKGAFFHHFKDKAELARALIERVSQQDYTAFSTWDAEADSATDDPLERVFHFLKLFEEFIDVAPHTIVGCMYTAYTYESMQFDAAINRFVSESIRRWTGIYERKFAAVLARYKPVRPVKASDLAEMIVSLIEGGFVLARAHKDPIAVSRQSKHFREYLELLFNKPGLSARYDKPLRKTRQLAPA